MILDEYLCTCTSKNQFSFKRKYATDLCIYTVKSVIKYYNYFSSSVLTCFLDDSKRSTELIINPSSRNTKSMFFTITNSDRQGGILSPKLFSIYIDNLSKMLNDSGTGCYVDTVCVNNVFYADDLCLMAPCAILLFNNC